MWVVEDLENAIDIVDLVSKYTNIKKAWANYKALCPFPWHSEKTPSFVISPSKQLAYCFGCHKWWGPLKFIMDLENCDFKEAMEILWSFTWIKVQSNFDQKNYEIKKNIYSLYKDAVSYYKKALKENPNIEKYLFDRWLTEETIKNFHFWYSDNWLKLYNYLREKWYDDKIIWDSNIFMDSTLKKDKFLNRIIFPIQNQRWDFVAFTARIIDKWEPKYLNSPASNIYDKSSILYWLYTARNSITKENFVIVTEWQMDTISMQSAWFLNTVAVSGSALTDKHIQMLQRLTKKIYLCFDSDWAWEKATKLSLELLKNKWLEIKIIVLPKWKDPDDIIKSGKDFNEFIKNAYTPVGYYIKKSNFKLDSIDDRKKLLAKLVDVINSYSDQIERETYIKEISKLLNVSENVIYDMINQFKFKWSQEMKVIKNKDFSLFDLAIAYIVINPNFSELFKEKLIFKDEIDIDLKRAIENINSFFDNLELSKKEKFRAVELMIEDKNESEEVSLKNVNDIINKINKDAYRKITNRLRRLMNENDMEAFKEYSNVMRIAKENRIK